MVNPYPMLSAPVRRSRRGLWLVVLVIVLGAAVWGLGIQAPPGPRAGRDFDPDRLADFEVRMWRAYYQQENATLFTTLLRALREQFRYPWAKAALASYYLGHAASTFGRAQSNYEVVLPDLERAYRIARDWSGAGFDPAQVAQAELAWWVARRTPEQRSPENVGRLIAVVYSKFYEVPQAKMEEAGLLRAKAADVRDRGDVTADWAQVGQLLHQSYRSLRTGLDK
jgi:hypothetical protein